MAEYYTNWETFTCTCPDWEKRRSGFSALDPRRLCKHLVEDFYELGSGSKEDEREDLFYEVTQFIEDILIEYNDEGEDWDEVEDDWEEEEIYKGFPLGQLCRTTAGMVVVNPEEKWAYVIDSSCAFLYSYEEDRWAFKQEMSPQAHKTYRELVGMAYNGQSIEGTLDTKIPG